MAQYRKKPVVIEANEWDGSLLDARKITDSFGNDFSLNSIIHKKNNGDISFLICTLEGDMTVSAGDFIIRGVSGEYYPCKPDIFEKTYELVN